MCSAEEHRSVNVTSCDCALGYELYGDSDVCIEKCGSAQIRLEDGKCYFDKSGIGTMLAITYIYGLVVLFAYISLIHKLERKENEERARRDAISAPEV